MTIRALVLEDEWVERNYLVELIEGTELGCVVAATGRSAEATAVLRSSEHNIDVAFVDIRLAGEEHVDAGLIWLRSAKDLAPQVTMVLTTASPEYAVEAYDLGVVDYLLKPFDADRVARCVSRVERRVAGREPVRRVAAHDGSGLAFVPLDEVLAFEASERLSYVHTLDRRLEVELSLTALGALLGGGRKAEEGGGMFMRVHRSWLVKLDAVRSLTRTDGETLLRVGVRSLVVPVARDRVLPLKAALASTSVGLRKL